MAIDYRDLTRNEKQPAERIADAIESAARSLEALVALAEEALGRWRSPGGFRATAGEDADAELVDQDDADLARLEEEDARRELTGREREQADGYSAEYLTTPHMWGCTGDHDMGMVTCHSWMAGGGAPAKGAGDNK